MTDSLDNASFGKKDSGIPGILGKAHCLKSYSSDQAEGAFVLVHDGSFPGFLCAVAKAINLVRSGSHIPTVCSNAALAGFFDIPVVVVRDDRRATGLWERLTRRIGGDALRTCLEAYCSDMPGREDAVAAVLMRMSREGRSVLDDLADPHSCLVEKAAARTRAQAHLVTGLVRFAELADGSWYAAIEPECRILALIAGHFASRFPTMHFVIHDLRRAEAVIHLPGKPWQFVERFSALSVFPGPELPLSENEIRIRTGWNRYFSSVAIKQRINPRLQSSHMPKKYWKHLPEMAQSGSHRADAGSIQPG